MSETTTSAAAGMRQRIRINVAKTATKGYTAETTVEVEWDGDGVDGIPRLADLLRLADGLARQEIAEREYEDGRR